MSLSPTSGSTPESASNSLSGGDSLLSGKVNPALLSGKAREDAIVLQGLSKAFRGIRALENLSLRVPRGTVFALVGPDGAGKSTLIRILCGLISPDAGTIHVLGLDSSRYRAELKKRIGYLSQRFSLYGDLSIDENIAFSAEIFGMRDYEAKRDELLDMTGLTPFRTRSAGKLSGGMKQKLALACTLVHDPELILLDEPTNGVDPVSRREFWKLLRGLGERNITLLMSTPYLDEAERADGVAFLHRGRLMLSGAPGDIRRDWEKTLLEFFCDRNRDAAAVLNRLYPHGEAQAFGDRVHLVLPGGGPGSAEVAAALEGAGVVVRRHAPARPGLEDVFLSLVGKADADA